MAKSKTMGQILSGHNVWNQNQKTNYQAQSLLLVCKISIWGTKGVLHTSNTCGWLGRKPFKYFLWRVHYSSLNPFIYSTYLSEWQHIMLSVVPLGVWGDGQHGRGLWFYFPLLCRAGWTLINICPLLYVDVSVCAGLGFKQVCIEVHYIWPHFNDEGKCCCVI